MSVFVLVTLKRCNITGGLKKKLNYISVFEDLSDSDYN